MYGKHWYNTLSSLSSISLGYTEDDERWSKVRNFSTGGDSKWKVEQLRCFCLGKGTMVLWKKSMKMVTGVRADREQSRTASHSKRTAWESSQFSFGRFRRQGSNFSHNVELNGGYTYCYGNENGLKKELERSERQADWRLLQWSREKSPTWNYWELQDMPWK